MKVPFLLGCLICWHIAIVLSYDFFFKFLWYHSSFLIFHLFSLFVPLSFLLGELVEKVYQFCLSFFKKKLPLGFTDLFFFYHDFISSLIFFIFFLLLTLGFVCSSFSSSEGLHCYKLPSEICYTASHRFLSIMFASSLTHWFSSSMLLFSLHVIVIFALFVIYISIIDT